MAKKIIKITILLLILSWWIYDHFFYVDLKNNCFVKIVPSITLEFTNKSTKKAIEILKNTSSEHYKKFCDNVNVINTNDECHTAHAGGCYSYNSTTDNNNKKKTIYSLISNQYPEFNSMVIVHETCHVLQHKEGRPHGTDLEAECYAKGDEYLKEVIVY